MKRESVRPGLFVLQVSLAVFFLSVTASAGPPTLTLTNTGWEGTTIHDWDPVTLTGTLTADVTEPVIIGSDLVTLDGDGYSILGSGSGKGILLQGLTGVTIKNLSITGTFYGIYLENSSANTVTGLTITGVAEGIYVADFSNNNSFISNKTL